MNNNTSETELAKVQADNLNSKMVLLTALLGKTVVHKKSGVIGDVTAVYEPGTAPPNSNPDLPTPNDVFIVLFREGHRFMLSQNKSIDDSVINEVFDILADNEKNFVHAAVGAVNVLCREIGTLAAACNIKENRALQLFVYILKETARVIAR